MGILTPQQCGNVHEESCRQVENIRKTSFLILILVFNYFCLSDVQSLDTSQCIAPLGMESGQIPDHDITASSSFDKFVGPQNGRVRVERQGGAWCAGRPATSEATEWLQIDLHTLHVITAVETQGRFGNGQGVEYSETYLVSYWRSTLNKWTRYRDINGSEILKGNINTYLPEKSILDPPIIASKLRILPHSNYQRTVCLRVEIYSACSRFSGPLMYNMPQGSARAETWRLYDFTYDGIISDGFLSSGLGALTDGKVAAVANLKDDYYKPERARGWVGWKNENSSNPLEIVFQFDSIREFNAIYIHTSNQFSEDVQVFAEAKVFFSVGGKVYPGEKAVTTKFPEDCIFETPKNVTIKLNHNVGQYVKIQLYWRSKWILISEIAFDSSLAMGNFTAEEDSISNRITSTAVSSTSTKTTVTTAVTMQSPSGTFKTKRNESEQILVHQVHQIPEDISVGASSRVTENWSMSSMTIVVTAVLSSFIAIVVVLVIIFTAMVVRHKLITLVKLPGSSQSSLHYGGASVSVVNDGLGPSVEFTTSSDDSPAKNLIKSTQISIGTLAAQDYHEPAMMATNFSSFKGSNSTTSTFHPRRGSFSNGHNQMTGFYSCSLISNSTLSHNQDSNEYEYVLPTEFGKLHQFSSPSRVVSSESCQQTLGRNRGIHLSSLGVPEIPRHCLKILKKLGEGTFGTVFVGELELEKCGPTDRRLVIAKRMLRNASEKDKLDFLTEINILSSLKNPNITQVLGVCFEDYTIILEFLELGDLCQFLRQNDSSHSAYADKLSLADLLFIALQIANGMEYFENKNIVHRDLACRNIVVGRGLTVKISHFGSEIAVFSGDYYRLDDKTPYPVRWMSMESVFHGKYSTRSDVWSYGVTLWEVLSYCRHAPYYAMTNQEVIANLRHLTVDEEADFFEFLEKPTNCPRDIYQLLCDCCCRNEDDRPSFFEISSYLSRKNIAFCTDMINHELPAYIEAHAHIQQYIV